MREVADGAIKIRESLKVEPVAAMGSSPASATGEGQVVCGRADAQSARDAGWKPALRRGGLGRQCFRAEALAGDPEEKAQQDCAPTKYRRQRRRNAGPARAGDCTTRRFERV